MIFSERLRFLALLLIPCASLNAQSQDALIAKINAEDPKSTIVMIGSNADNRLFAVKSLATSARTLGTVILLHDKNENADWPLIIHPLRTMLPLYGWNTFSAQLPELKVQQNNLSAILGEIIKSAQSENLSNLAFVCRGRNAYQIVEALSTHTSNVNALVLVSAESPSKNAASELVDKLLRLNAPILDIYAELDRIDVISDAALRLNLIKQRTQATAPSHNSAEGSNIVYQQLAIGAAKHNFRGQEQQLSKRIAGWLQKNIKQGNVNSMDSK